MMRRMDLSSPRACGKCKKRKPAKAFYRRGPNDPRLHHYCRDCFNAYCRARWKARKAQYVEEMGGYCKDCRGVFPLVVYDFHHRNMAKKEYSWAKLRLRPDADIRRELKKCDLLCANCHRIRHAAERGGA